MKALDAIPSMFTTYAYYNNDKFPFCGEALMKRSMAFRTPLDAGIHSAAGSDFSPGPFAPLMGIPSRWENWRILWCWPTIHTPRKRTPSKTLPLSPRLSVGRRCTKRSGLTGGKP